MVLWVLLIGLLTAGMVLGLAMMWRQRRHLRSLARDEFEDDQWGFGQIAALTIWVPVLVELLYILNGEELLILGGFGLADMCTWLQTWRNGSQKDGVT